MFIFDHTTILKSKFNLKIDEKNIIFHNTFDTIK